MPSGASTTNIALAGLGIGLGGRHFDIFPLSGSTGHAFSHFQRLGPLTVGATLERRSANAVPHAVLGAASARSEGTVRAWGGSRAGLGDAGRAVCGSLGLTLAHGDRRRV